MGKIIALLALLCFPPLALLFSTSTVAVQTTVPGYEGVVKLYPRSEVVHRDDNGEIESQRLILGTIKKIDNVTEPEFAKYLLAKKTTVTAYIPNEQRTEVVTDYFREQLTRQGRMLFECAGRECGSSNYWANKVFGRPVLYGPEKFQHYMVALLETGPPAYILVYTAQRGNRKVYAHIEILSEVKGDEVSDAASIVKTLESQRKLIITDLSGGERFEQALILALKQLKGPFAMVGHGVRTADADIEGEIQRTGELANAYLQKLMVKGLPAGLVSAHGVGPLSPNDRYDRDRIEILWLR